MGRLNLVLFLSVLMLVSYVPLSLPTEAAGGRSLVDFAVMSITVGNASTPAQTWEQPDGSSEDYIVRNRQVEITVTFKQAGSSNSNASSTLWVQIWHPVGTLVQELQVNLTGAIGSPNQALTGGEERVEKVVWTPTAAHSILDDNGTLSGGYIVKGIIHGLVDDGNDANDELSDEVPVAIWYDSMDRGICSYSPCAGSPGGQRLPGGQKLIAKTTGPIRCFWWASRAPAPPCWTLY